MDPIVSLFSILAALILGAISPGPSFLFVARTAVAVSRRSGVASAIGMGLGASIVCALALPGASGAAVKVQRLYQPRRCRRQRRQASCEVSGSPLPLSLAIPRL